ncbi:hypothetical protein ACFX1T_009633 [Malus domestica]
MSKVAPCRLSQFGGQKNVHEWKAQLRALKLMGLRKHQVLAILSSLVLLIQSPDLILIVPANLLLLRDLLGWARSPSVASTWNWGRQQASPKADSEWLSDSVSDPDPESLRHLERFKKGFTLDFKILCLVKSL